MTCIVIDDEEFAARHLIDYNIKKNPFLTLLGAYTNPREALYYLKSHPVDLVFLDIEMPNFDINGIDFMKINRPQQQYILVTAHSQYALQSYEFNVIDYLQKPFSFDRFVKAVQKAQQFVQLGETGSADAIKPVDSLFLKSDKKLQRVFFDSICYVEVDRNYATIFRDGDQIATKTTLSKLEEDLPISQFVRVHKSHIVALDKIAFVEKHQVGITRAGGVVEVPLSSQHKKALLQAIDKRS